MWISNFSISRPIITITMMLALVAFGVAALLNLQVDEYPDLDQPVVMVQIPYPGASPDVVEREIIEPIEEAIFGLSGLDRKLTTANAVDGLAQFTVTFNYTKPVTEASQDVRDAISTIRGNLPSEMEEPIITRFDWGAQPIISLTLSSDVLDARALTMLADPGIGAGDLEGALLTVLVGLPLPEFVALDGDHRPRAADLGARGFIAVWAFGFTLNTMSLLGLSLAIGILIDDAIVVRENIVRHVEMGKDHYTAAREGTAEIGLAVAATTFSIVAVFVPIAFMAGRSGSGSSRSRSRSPARCWCRSSCRSRSTRCSRPTGPIRTSRSTRSRAHHACLTASTLVRVADRALCAAHRLGARPPLVDGGRWRSCSFVGALGSSGCSQAVFVPVTDRGEFEVIVEAPPSASLDYTIERPRRSRRSPRAVPGGGIHLQRRGHAAADADARRGPVASTWLIPKQRARQVAGGDRVRTAPDSSRWLA
jgi:hypothetical protein